MTDSWADAFSSYFCRVDVALESAVADPRAANCRGFMTDSAGRVISVELVHVPIPTASYALLRVELIEEEAAQGNTVASCVVLDANGVQTAESVYLAWPFPDLSNRALPGNPNNQHMIMNGYAPPSIGPLALYVGDRAGAPISDVIGGLGLPGNRHVCYRATWQERTAEPEPEPHPSSDSFGRIAAALERLAAHLGA